MNSKEYIVFTIVILVIVKNKFKPLFVQYQFINTLYIGFLKRKKLVYFFPKPQGVSKKGTF